MLLVHMVTGMFPDHQRRARQIQAAKFSISGQPFREILEACLQEDPAARPTASALCAMLLRAVPRDRMLTLSSWQQQKSLEGLSTQIQQMQMEMLQQGSETEQQIETERAAREAALQQYQSECRSAVETVTAESTQRTSDVTSSLERQIGAVKQQVDADMLRIANDQSTKNATMERELAALKQAVQQLSLERIVAACRDQWNQQILVNVQQVTAAQKTITDELRRQLVDLKQSTVTSRQLEDLRRDTTARLHTVAAAQQQVDAAMATVQDC
eukprot:TRINITY_DN6170_c0_g2_i1.p1 TRINITY_DN6170_c0_g2~~TRINITY_DN6170_c0_g2_i1.p1  ORF type:complete len:271 (-),score=83.26 TRINITY_DN6170_c0_g2_i1:160-972(-)